MPRQPRRTPPKEPDLPPEKTQAALKKQLSTLDRLRGRNYRDAEHEETEWVNLTVNILTRGFGEASNNVSQFHTAEGGGGFYFGERSEGEKQRDFDDRINRFTAVLKSSLAELELLLPEPHIAGAYESGDEYRFYRDLKTIVGFAAAELFITDNYLDTQLFDVYMENVASSVSVRVMTETVSTTLRLVADKFAKRGSFELRSSKHSHDRVVFADDRCWVIGQSIKDAAKKKPTYIVEMDVAVAMKGIYESIWASGTLVVRS